MRIASVFATRLMGPKRVSRHPVQADFGEEVTGGDFTSGTMALAILNAYAGSRGSVPLSGEERLRACFFEQIVMQKWITTLFQTDWQRWKDPSRPGGRTPRQHELLKSGEWTWCFGVTRWLSFCV
jgi:hypothetical protein